MAGSKTTKLTPEKETYGIMEVCAILGQSRPTVQKLFDDGLLFRLPGLHKTTTSKASLLSYLSGTTTAVGRTDRLTALLQAEWLELGYSEGETQLLSCDEYCSEMKAAIDQGRRFPPYLMKFEIGDPETLSQHPYYDLAAVIMLQYGQQPITPQKLEEARVGRENHKLYDEFEKMGFHPGDLSFTEFLSLERREFIREILGR